MEGTFNSIHHWLASSRSKQSWYTPNFTMQSLVQIYICKAVLSNNNNETKIYTLPHWDQLESYAPLATAATLPTVELDLLLQISCILPYHRARVIIR